jgi:hypothetical protein
MNDFDTRWQELAARARRAPGREESAPLGFATRVLARLGEPHRPSGEEIWGRLTLRLLSVALPVLVLCAILEAPHLRHSPSLESGVENTVAQILWRL